MKFVTEESESLLLRHGIAVVVEVIQFDIRLVACIYGEKKIAMITNCHSHHPHREWRVVLRAMSVVVVLVDDVDC